MKTLKDYIIESDKAFDKLTEKELAEWKRLKHASSMGYQLTKADRKRFDELLAKMYYK